VPDTVLDKPEGPRTRADRVLSGWTLRSALAVPELKWALIATVLFAVGAAAHLLGAPAVVWWGLYLACYVTGGWEPALAGLRALREKTLDVDLLMIVAAIVAASIGQVLDGALLIVIFATSGALEAVATKRTEDSVRALLTLAPERATRVHTDGAEQAVLVDELSVGHIIRIRPGERIGADGEVLDGSSEVDQASITGESMPVLKVKGDEVFAGTLNGTGALRVRVGRDANDTVVARIVGMVQEASATKAKTQLFIEKIEQRYSIGMVTATLALFLIPLGLGHALEPTLLRAMTFMIVASPCAVVLATMPPLLSAIANAGRHGVLVKSAVVMEQLGLATVVAFDKTGTLTEGAPQVVEVIPLLEGDGQLQAAVLLQYAAAVEISSEHPIGTAIVTAARDRQLEVPAADGFDSQPGRGVTGIVNGALVRVGSPGVLAEVTDGNGDRLQRARQTVARMEAEGATAVVVLRDGSVIGILGLADRLRAGAREAVQSLAAITGREPILLTGDNPGSAKLVANQVGIKDVHASLLPQDKVEKVRALQREQQHVVLVGDGVNDAPAMAAAELGIALGYKGSDLALETSDVVIVRDDLSTISAIVGLSRRARRVVVANLVIAFTMITILVIWDLAGHLPLPLGVAGHEGSTVIVGLNGLRLLRSSVWRRANQAPDPRPGSAPESPQVLLDSANTHGATQPTARRVATETETETR
jgi:heavy metal translocating P-type ATPase